MAAWPSTRRAIWFALTAILLLTRLAAAADPAISADFDGDGHRDRVTLDRAQPSVLRIWLSSTNATAEIHSHTPIVRLAARDLDGDRRSELIANADGRLQVWTRKRHGFHAFRSHGIVDADMSRPGRRAFDDGPVESRAAIQWTPGPSLALTLAPQPRAPGPGAPHTVALRDASHPAMAPLSICAPRPPPALL